MAAMTVDRVATMLEHARRAHFELLQFPSREYQKSTPTWGRGRSAIEKDRRESATYYTPPREFSSPVKYGDRVALDTSPHPPHGRRPKEKLQRKAGAAREPLNSYASGPWLA